jgi:nucleotidyltransferase substrate binding protein (TIGR01987 family)
MESEDIRWKQRFQNFRKAHALLENAVNQLRLNGLSDLEQQGLIQRFEFTHELAWNVMKDYLEYQGKNDLMGSRDATREAFQNGLIEDGESWMEMLKSRNQSSHTYNEKVAEEIVHKIADKYARLFSDFSDKMISLQNPL